jgi:catechol 2,3-dioxygenase-like lactoylglutathione lyase family enzyme
MALIGLDHVNIRTADLDWLCRFYEDVLGPA